MRARHNASIAPVFPAATKKAYNWEIIQEAIFFFPQSAADKCRFQNEKVIIMKECKNLNHMCDSVSMRIIEALSGLTETWVHGMYIAIAATTSIYLQ